MDKRARVPLGLVTLRMASEAGGRFPFPPPGAGGAPYRPEVEHFHS